MILTDKEGYLQNIKDWNETTATSIAQREGVILTQAHWELIIFVRDFYQRHQIAPAIRVLVKSMKEHYGPEKGNSLYLQSLFPKGAAKQLSKIAGLPKPTHCT